MFLKALPVLAIMNGSIIMGGTCCGFRDWGQAGGILKADDGGGDGSMLRMWNIRSDIGELALIYSATGRLLSFGETPSRYSPLRS